MLVCSVPSTWSICTGADVWEAGTVKPLSASGESGVPGRMSMNRLPSKKMRGRTLISAFSWIGRASSSSFMVTSTAGESPPIDSTPDDLAHVHARDADGLVLLDGWRVLEDGLELVGLGERDVLREGEEHRHREHDDRDQAHLEGGEPVASRRTPHGLTPAAAALMPFWPLVLVRSGPGALLSTVCPRTNCSFPASHSLGCPGAAELG